MVTYLLGAGASCQSLPLIKDIPSAIDKILDIISTSEYDFSSYKSESFATGLDIEKARRNLIKDLIWLKESAKKHASIDTFAKKLKISSKDGELDMMKIVLSAFLSLTELINGIDKRYDSLIASLCNDDLRLPNNVNFLTWNYDTQIERCFSQYSEYKDYKQNCNLLDINTKGCSTFSKTPGKIIKLNGSAILRTKGAVEIEPFVSNLHANFDKENFLEFLLKYHLLCLQRTYLPGISYAWEDELKLKDDIIKLVENTRVLVIIGYSFPFFNREIDRLIVRSMNRLQTIYYQTPEDVSIAQNRVEAVIKPLGRDIIPFVYSDCSQFFLPPEL